MSSYFILFQRSKVVTNAAKPSSGFVFGSTTLVSGSELEHGRSPPRLWLFIVLRFRSGFNPTRGRGTSVYLYPSKLISSQLFFLPNPTPHTHTHEVNRPWVRRRGYNWCTPTGANNYFIPFCFLLLCFF